MSRGWIGRGSERGYFTLPKDRDALLSSRKRGALGVEGFNTDEIGRFELQQRNDARKLEMAQALKEQMAATKGPGENAPTQKGATSPFDKFDKMARSGRDFVAGSQGINSDYLPFSRENQGMNDFDKPNVQDFRIYNPALRRDVGFAQQTQNMLNRANSGLMDLYGPERPPRVDYEMDPNKLPFGRGAFRRGRV